MLRKALHIDMIYTELPFEERFAAAKKSGFDAIELNGFGWDERDPDELNKLLKDNELELVAVTGANPYSMCDPAQKEDYLACIKKMIAASKKIGSPTLMVLSNAVDESKNWAACELTADYSDATKICAMYDVLKTMAKWGEEEGVSIVLEVLSEMFHPGIFLHDVKLGADLVRAVNSPRLKLLYDFYHVYLESGKVCESFTEYLDAIGHVHCADAPGRHEPGTGAINYRNVMKYIADSGYDGAVGFEFYPEHDSKTACEAACKVCEGIL